MKLTADLVLPPSHALARTEAAWKIAGWAGIEVEIAADALLGESLRFLCDEPGARVVVARMPVGFRGFVIYSEQYGRLEHRSVQKELERFSLTISSTT